MVKLCSAIGHVTAPSGHHFEKAKSHAPQFEDPKILTLLISSNVKLAKITDTEDKENATKLECMAKITEKETGFGLNHINAAISRLLKDSDKMITTFATSNVTRLKTVK